MCWIITIDMQLVLLFMIISDAGNQVLLFIIISDAWQSSVAVHNY